MKKQIVLIMVFMFGAVINPIIAQEDVRISKNDFKDLKEGFDEAWENIREGENYFERGKIFYKMALPHYLAANKYNPDNAELNYKIGVCYIYSDKKPKALSYLQQASKLKSDVAKDILYFTARAYHYNYKFDEAVEAYTTYRNSLSSRDFKEEGRKIDKLIQECYNGKELMKNPLRVFVDNAGKNINSAYSDYSPLITADESMMIFTSRRENTTGGKKNIDNSYFEDIYVSYKKHEEWTSAKNLGEPLNTENNDATVGISPDGQQLFVYKGNIGNGDIFVCHLDGDTWSEPEDLPRTINTKYQEASASFSPDGNTMYFVSNRQDLNFGKRDIYMSKKNKKGEWGEAVNLGNVVNSPESEMGVFMHPDGRTLYFSSRGHNTMGGYDVFKTYFNDSSWAEPQNVGYPINTPDDDVFFVMTASGRKAYYSSIREDGLGDRDIYSITYLNPELIVLSNEDNLLAGTAESTIREEDAKNVETMTNVARLTLLSGTITDSKTGKPIGATIEIVDNEKNEVVSEFASNTKTGNYLVSLPAGKNYGIAVKADGYLFHSEHINIPKISDYQEITNNIELHKIEVGAKIILKNIFFETGKSDINLKYDAELKRLVKVMNENPTIQIEISGHTDNVGSYASNKALSQARAKAVVDYLILHDIEPKRLTHKGYSYDKPIATNDTEEGRQKNRRVEFVIIKK